MAEVVHWLGDASESSVSVCVRVDTTGSYVLNLNGVASAPLALNPAVNFGVGRFDVGSLATDTRYPWTITLSGVVQASGTARTMPTADQSFYVGFLSCWRQSGDPGLLYQAIENYDVRAFFGIGDLPYPDAELSGNWLAGGLPGIYTAPTDINTWHNQLLAFHRDVPAVNFAFQRAPFYRMWDDHDSLCNDFDHELANTNATFIGNGGLAFGSQALLDAAFNLGRQAFDIWSIGNPTETGPFVLPWKPAAAAAGTPLTNYPAQYFSKAIGSAQFHCLDLISHRSTTAAADDGTLIEHGSTAKTMAGRPQMAWLKSKLVQSQYEFNPIMSPKVTMKGATTSDNNGWSDCPTERNHLLDWIGANARGVVWGAGDVHTAFVINDERHALMNASSINWSEQTQGGPDLGEGYVEGYAWKIHGYQRSDTYYSPRSVLGLIYVTPNYLDWLLVSDAGVELTRWRQQRGANTLRKLF